MKERPRGRPFGVERGYVGALPCQTIISEENARILLKRPDEIYSEIKKIYAERAALLEQAARPEEQPPPEVENKKPANPMKEQPLPEEQPPPHNQAKKARSYGLAFTGAFPGGPGLLGPKFIKGILDHSKRVRKELAERLRARFSKRGES